MKHSYIITILFAVAAILPATAQSIEDRYNKRRPVVMICDWDRPPYEYINDAGQLAGSNIDVMKAIMEELGIPVRFIMKDWEVALNTFASGDADIILADARRFRDGDYAISHNIVNYNRVCVATYKDSVMQMKVDELNQKGTVLKTGEFSVNYFHTDSTIVPKVEFQTPKVALLGLISGEFKYFIWGELQLKWKIKELNLDGIVLNDVDMPISEVHFIGHDKELIQLIDDQYSRLKQSGELAQLKDKWLHHDQPQTWHMPRALYITLVALFIAALLYLASRLVKAHVKSATRDQTMLNEMMIKALHMGNYDVMVYHIAKDRVENAYGHILPDGGMSMAEFLERIHPDQQEEFWMKAKGLINGREKSFALNKRWNQGTDENPHWLNFHGHAILEVDSAGRPSYVVNAIYDVTHEEAEHKAARELNYKYNVLANTPLVAMSFYDREGNLISLNDAMKKLCSISDKTPQARGFWEAVNLFDLISVNGIRPDINHEALQYCQRLNYPDLKIDEYVESYIYPLFNEDGLLTNYLVGSMNLTSERNSDKECHQLEQEHELLEEKIRKQHRLLQFILTNNLRFLVRTNIEQQSLTFFRALGRKERAYSFEELKVNVEERDHDLFLRMIGDAERRESESATIHMKPRAEDGHDNEGRVYRMFLTPIIDDNNHVEGHEGVCVDITQQTATAEKLAETTRLAEDSLKMKSAFMASMAHELRTPLNGIVGFTGVLEALGDTPERSEYVHIIRNSSDMLQRLINDIILASSISEGAFAIEPREVDFVRKFNDICLSLEQRVINAGLQFIKDNPYEQLMIMVDIGRVEQILTNFVTNAVKFTQQGHIKVGYRFLDGELHLYCEDTGAGIPKDKQQKVFERFVKLDEFVQGTGMGLAICKSIAEKCGGSIGVVSEGAGKGSVFWCKLRCSCSQGQG